MTRRDRVAAIKGVIVMLIVFEGTLLALLTSALVLDRIILLPVRVALAFALGAL